MVEKLVVLILCAGVTMACLLSVRQQRLQVVCEMTDHLERAGELRRSLWEIRVFIAREASAMERTLLSTPSESLQPIPVDWARMIDDRYLLLRPGAESTADERAREITH